MTTKLQFKCSIGPEGCYQGITLTGFLAHVQRDHPQALQDHHGSRHDSEHPAPCACWEDGYTEGREDAAQEPRKPGF